MGTQEKKPPGHLALKYRGFDGRDFTGMGEANFILEGLLRGPMHMKTQGEKQ